MLGQIKWEVQNRPIIENQVLPETTLFFWRFCFSLRTSYKELIWCTSYRLAIFTLLVSAEILFKDVFSCESPEEIWSCFLEETIFFSIAAESIWFAFCFGTNFFTSWILNLLFPLVAEGRKAVANLILIYPFLFLLIKSCVRYIFASLFF